MPKSFIATVFLILLCASSLAQQTSTSQPPAPAQSAAASAASGLTSQKDRFSYAVGMNLGLSFQRQSVPVDLDLLVKGIKDGISGGQMLLTEQEAGAAITAVRNELRKQQAEKAQQQGEANKKEGAEFLASNKTKPGVTTLPSGLQYKVITAGSGPKPAATDTVTVNYRGTLINGTEFDSSYKRGQPATFAVNGVIKGWTEALQLMPVGSKWQLFIPAELAYADHAASETITPNSTLIFEVELLSIKPAEKPADQPAAKPEEKK